MYLVELDPPTGICTKHDDSGGCPQVATFTDDRGRAALCDRHAAQWERLNGRFLELPPSRFIYLPLMR